MPSELNFIIPKNEHLSYEFNETSVLTNFFLITNSWFNTTYNLILLRYLKWLLVLLLSLSLQPLLFRMTFMIEDDVRNDYLYFWLRTIAVRASN